MQQDLLGTSRDLLTSLDRSAATLNMVAHTLENEFAERFGHTGVSFMLKHAPTISTTDSPNLGACMLQQQQCCVQACSCMSAVVLT